MIVTWQEHEVRTGDRRNGSAGAQQWMRLKRDVAQASKDSPREVKSDVPKIAHAVVHIVSEHIQKQHVEQQMRRVGVEELIGEIVQQRRRGGVERVSLRQLR